MRSPTSRSARSPRSAATLQNLWESVNETGYSPRVHMISPQSAKCPQLTVRVTELLCNLQGVRPSRAGFRRRTFGIDQRGSECRVQLHFVARASRRIRPEVGKRAFDAHATLVQ